MTGLLFSSVAVCTLALSAAAVHERTRRRASAAARHAVWVLAALVVLAWPVIAMLAPVWKTPSVVAPVWNLPPLSRPEVLILTPPGSPGLSPVAPVGEGEVVASGPLRGTSLLLGVWALGALLLIGVAASRYISAYRLIRRARPIVDPELARDLDQVARACGVSRMPSLLQSPEVTSPVAWGFGAGSIVFPAWLTDTDPATRRAILHHEMAHIARRDHFAQMLVAMLAAVHWYHPLAWVGRAATRRNAEMACDDHVLRAGALPSWYADQLLRLATRASAPSQLPVPGLMGSGDLEGRIVSLTDGSRVRTAPSAWHTGALASGVFCLATALAGARPPMLSAARDFTPPSLPGFVAIADVDAIEPQGARPVIARTPLWHTVDGMCPDFIGRRDLVRHCEHRETTLAVGSLTLVAAQNGDVTIRGSDTDRVRVRAILDVQADGLAAAQELTDRIRLHTDGQLRPEVPELGMQEWVGITFVVEVPRNIPIRISTANGNVVLRDLSAVVEIATINGTIDLADMSGEITASGNNAQYRVRLDASAPGARYDLNTHNGSIDVVLSDAQARGIDLRSERGEVRADGATRASLSCNRSPGGCLGGRIQVGDSLHALLRGRTTHGNITLRSPLAGAPAQ